MNCVKSAHALWLMAAGALAGAGTAVGLPYSIDWSSMDAGVTTSSSTLYTITGTVGQPDAGPCSSATYALEGGFWCVRVAPVPLLSFARGLADALIISWPASEIGCGLVERTDVAKGAWTPVSATPVQVGASMQVIIRPAGESKFYRLKRQ